MKKCLMVIDYVFDFVSDNGALTCGEPAQLIDSNISNLVTNFSINNDLIVVATDFHYENDITNPERKLFPPHCITDEGRAIYGSTGKSLQKVTSNNLITINKNKFSAFCDTNLHNRLKENNITDVTLCGVCTDICILHTAIDAYNLGHNITIHSNTVTSFNRENHHFALSHIKNTLGATII